MVPPPGPPLRKRCLVYARRPRLTVVSLTFSVWAGGTTADGGGGGAVGVATTDQQVPCTGEGSALWGGASRPFQRRTRGTYTHTPPRRTPPARRPSRRTSAATHKPQVRCPLRALRSRGPAPSQRPSAGFPRQSSTLWPRGTGTRPPPGAQAPCRGPGMAPDGTANQCAFGPCCAA